MSSAWIWGSPPIDGDGSIGWPTRWIDSRPCWRMKKGGGGSSQAGSLAMSQSQGSLSQSRGQSVKSSGAASRSRAPSQTQSKAQTEVEVALSEGDDEFLEIYVTEPERTVGKGSLSVTAAHSGT